MEQETLLKNFAWLYFISNTLGVIILIDYILFNRPYLTVFILTCAATFYANYKFFLFFRGGDLQQKLEKKRGLKLYSAFFGNYFAFIFSQLLPETNSLLSRLKKIKPQASNYSN